MLGYGRGKLPRSFFCFDDAEKQPVRFPLRGFQGLQRVLGDVAGLGFLQFAQPP
ncbi:MAG: hypothetical protein M5R36_28940 [Deltaproteobacteria bacterium]|nr:hypothetical protein [Deltaproteobacteria bacterium]